VTPAGVAFLLCLCYSYEVKIVTMNKNILPPSPFGKGTTYSDTEKHIVRPPMIDRSAAQEHQERSVGTPRVVEAVGAVAVEDYVSIFEVQELSPSLDSYAGVASRNAHLDYVEVENRKRAAREVGKTVDEWNDSRHKG